MKNNLKFLIIGVSLLIAGLGFNQWVLTKLFPFLGPRLSLPRGVLIAVFNAVFLGLGILFILLKNSGKKLLFSIVIFLCSMAVLLGGTEILTKSLSPIIKYYPITSPGNVFKFGPPTGVIFTPNYRGYLHFTGVTLARPDILGLFMRNFRIQKAEKLLVLPRRYPLDPPELTSSRQYNPGGGNLASSIGNSDEFMSLRYYRPGDPLRNIHWRTFARTGELVIKEFEDEFFVRHALILDTFVSPEKEAVFEEAVSIAASYVASVEPHDAILDLVVAGKEINSFSLGRGLGNSEKMLEILSCVESCPDKTLLELKPVLESGLKKISGAICIFSGWEKEHEEIYRMIHEALVPVFIIVLAGDEVKKEHLVLKTGNLHHRVRVVQIGAVLEELAIP